jgi:hypothetical protein
MLLIIAVLLFLILLAVCFGAKGISEFFGLVIGGTFFGVLAVLLGVIVAGLLASLLSGCVQDKPVMWASINDKPTPLETAKLVCDGEVAKADATNSGDHHGMFWEARELALDAKVRAGCMASQGWKQQ